MVIFFIYDYYFLKAKIFARIIMLEQIENKFNQHLETIHEVRIELSLIVQEVSEILV